MYNTRPGLLIGFHGCDAAQQEFLLKNPLSIPTSTNAYDWLGHGMYFWENNYDRALQWAQNKQARGKIKQAAVIGAVFDLQYCCDLLDTRFTTMLSTYHKLMELDYSKLQKNLPVNVDAADDPNQDKLIRFLDCATIEFMHKEVRRRIKKNVDTTGYTKYKAFDSVRGVFTEGAPA